MFSGLSPGVYTLRVVATNRKPDKVFITIRFEITDDPDRCTLHLINEGVSVREEIVSEWNSLGGDLLVTTSVTSTEHNPISVCV